MTFPLPQDRIEAAFLSACQGELVALKPGNVHRHASGHGMEVAHFESAALAAAPHIAQRGMKIGQRIRRAVEASFQAAGCNTNLGIILLCAPLAYAAGEVIGGKAGGPGATIWQRLSSVLAGLDRLDAQDAFAAIAYANPAGLGDAAEGNVHAPADVTLLSAMRLSADRDRIALAYVTDFADIFEYALPLYQQAVQAAPSREQAITILHMHLLAEFPDTHIARKWGASTARAVQDEARSLKAFARPDARHEDIERLASFDSRLKQRGLNPGTTADFVVATLFTAEMACPGV